MADTPTTNRPLKLHATPPRQCGGDRQKPRTVEANSRAADKHSRPLVQWLCENGLSDLKKGRGGGVKK